MSGANLYSQELKHREDQLAIQYLPAVKAMSFRLKERLPSSVDYMDLSAIGTEELVKLARRYDEAQNDSFWGYAKTRVYFPFFVFHQRVACARLFVCVPPCVTSTLLFLSLAPRTPTRPHAARPARLPFLSHPKFPT